MRLQRRLFLWFGASILGAALAVGAVFGIFEHIEGRGRAQWAGSRELVGRQAERVWDSPADRERWAEEIHDTLGWSLRLEDPNRVLLSQHGPVRRRGGFDVPVRRDGTVIGHVRIAWGASPGEVWQLLAVVLVLLTMLWGAAGRISRKIAWPVAELTRVAQDLGEGRLGSRYTGRARGEIRELAMVMNTMAARIERQLADQRELLATVSHELRTPLSRVRLLLELGRTGAEASKTYDEVEREVLEMDALVGALLAGARLDFAAMDRVPLDGVELAGRALERAALPPSLLRIHTPETQLTGDPTLLGRALSNLLDNATRHGGGATELLLRDDEGALVFEVLDAGPGLADGDADRIFQAFYRGRAGEGGARGPSLGLGLALVRRIAEAHGGRAEAANLPGGGARVGFSVPRTSRGPPPA